MDNFLSGVEKKRFKEQTSAFVLRKSAERANENLENNVK
jgi:hypothetical protein